MKERLLVLRLALTVLLAGANASADPILTSVSADAQSPNPVCRGEQATYTVTVSRSGSGNMEIYLSAAGLPRGVTANFAPNPVKFTGSSTTSATSTLAISTAPTTAPWNYSWRVIATDGASHNTLTNTSSLNVTMCSPGAATAPDGSLCLAFAGTPGQSCRIEATTNLDNPV